MTTPGWHPDPGGLWEHRWWNGSSWGPEVKTGQHLGNEAYPTPTGAPVDRNAAVVEFDSKTVSAHTEHYVLTWESLLTFKSRSSTNAPTEVLPLWMVLGIDVWVGAVKSTRGLGDVRLSIGYTGYVGPSTKVLRNIAHPDWAKAVIWRQRGLAAATARTP